VEPNVVALRINEISDRIAETQDKESHGICPHGYRWVAFFYPAVGIRGHAHPFHHHGDGEMALATRYSYVLT
jgi:hypothetical protein